MSDHLEPIDPHEAVQMYTEHHRHELADTTLRSRQSRLEKFARWCDRNDIDDMNELTGRTVHQFALHLRSYFTKDNEETPSKCTMKTRLSTLRVFLRFCEDIDAVPEGLADKVELPTLTPEERRRDSIIPDEDATRILERLSEFRYATQEHAIFLLAWRTAARIGTLRALDVDDLDGENNRLYVQHRPESETPLKNKGRGERVVALREETVTVLKRYIEIHRPPVTDDYGREPLFCTRHGRPEKSTLRQWIYRAQLPCYHSNDCPHGTNQQECDYWKDKQRRHCPSTVPPHDVRRGAITHYLTDDVPETAISDRADVSKQTLDNHYDKRTEEQRSEQRRQFFE